jgi:hypothetical protein
MAIIAGFGSLVIVSLILLLAVVWGQRALDFLDCKTTNTFEEVLFAVAFFFGFFEIILFFLAVAGKLQRSTIIALLALFALSAGRRWYQLPSLMSQLWAWASSLCKAREMLVYLLVILFLGLEWLLTTAPLTGSDALHYHFTAPLLENGRRLWPIFSILHSFLTGQGHTLISLGLALGSDRISLGLIFLGGLLTAGVLYAICQRLCSPRWAILAVLTFIATPMVFWQITVAGAPDIWIGFFSGIAVLAASRGVEPGNERCLALAGFFAGAGAGIKYTSWILPVAITLYIVASRRSAKWGAACGLASLLGGGWPLARNMAFTGDPFFPFLTRWISPGHLNSFALSALISDTRSRDGITFDSLFSYPVQMVLQGEHLGLGQLYGPIVLVFAPLLVFVPWKNRIARITALVWSSLFLSNLLSTQMARFLLPAYPLILALVFSGFSEMSQEKWRFAHAALRWTLLVFLCFAAVSDCLYAKSYVPVAVGLESREQFLERWAPDYEVASFVNRTLAPSLSPGINQSVMVFFRHLYYLRIPFVNGDPKTSWVVDPSRCASPKDMLGLIHELHVRWLVKVDDYPEPLASVLTELEGEGKIVPIATTEVENFTGSSRIYNQRVRERVVLLSIVD